MPASFKGKTVVVTGGSRGIGLAIALRFAASGANVAILTKDTKENIEEAARQIIVAGGKAIALDIDVSNHDAIKQGIGRTVDQFGSIDILVNNTSATCFTDTLHTLPEKFDLAIATSVRAAFFMSQACLRYLKEASNPHIINISPPLNLDPLLVKDYLAFSISKYGMSMCTLGMAAEFQKEGIAVNSLWPETTIATQTIKDHFVPQVFAGSRWPSIMGDAAYELALRSSRACSGQFFTDEVLLREAGVVDFSCYTVDASAPLMQALFIPIEKTPVSQEFFLMKLSN